MGLEIVELGILMEEEFGIQIPDADYEQFRTVGDLERYVTWRLGRDAAGWPRSQLALLRSFCQIRREIVRQTGLARSRLRPSTQLQQHWPSLAEWRAAKTCLSAVLEVQLPGWQVEGWMLAGCLGALFTPVVALVCLAGDLSMLWVPVSGLVCWSLGVLGAIAKAERRFREATLASVTREACGALSQRQGMTRPSSIDGDEGNVLSRVTVLVSQVACIPAEKIHPQSRLYEDLMMG